MKIAWHDNRGNGARLKAALEGAGHRVVDAITMLARSEVGDVLLTDYDAPNDEPYKSLCDAHKKVLVHPHGGGLVGWNASHPHTVAQFVPGPGQAEVLRRCGYTERIEVIGWSFSEQRPFRDLLVSWDGRYSVHKREVRCVKILFALQHSMADGFIEPWYPVLHQTITDQLGALPVNVTVRTVEKPGAVVLHAGWTHVEGDGTVADAVRAVDAADLVIGPAWTLPSIAIARGVPTIMYGQVPRAIEGYGYQSQPAASWEKVRDVAMYPLYVEREPPTPDGLATLMTGAMLGHESKAWREQFIGPPFDPAAFVRMVEEAVRSW